MVGQYHHGQNMQQVPQVGTIERGTVQRIEPYGAFVGLETCRLVGLVHISQLANCNIDRVEDAVAVNDVVFVKIVDVSTDMNGRPKIRLSLKDASQDGSYQDLGSARDQTVALSQQIQQKLQSSIGMGVALDPMAKTSHLILKSDQKSKTVINGYALVDDTEGEAPPVVVTLGAAPPVPAALAPMGRGRGTTLPAWMTQSDGPVKDNERLKKQSKKEKKQKHKRRDNDDDPYRQTRSYSEHDESDERRHRRHKHRERERRSPDSEDRSNKPSSKRSSRRRRSRSHSYSSDSNGFGNVEEAKRLIAELEAKKQRL